MSQGRDKAVEALRANPMAIAIDEYEDALRDPEGDVSFDDLGLDSLGRMELSIWLEMELGLEVTEAELAQLASLRGLAAFLDQNMHGGN